MKRKKNLSKIEANFSGGEKKTNSFKINYKKCYNIKKKLNNIEQVMNIEKVNEFKFLNEEVEEFASSWSQTLVNAERLSYLKQKAFDIVYEA